MSGTLISPEVIQEFEAGEFTSAFEKLEKLADFGQPQQGQQQPQQQPQSKGQQPGQQQQGQQQAPGAADDNYESAFFQMAYSKLQSKLFNLLPFFVGFELVKKSEDGSKAIGVFAFKSDNGQILFVPTFFINGKVKELDTMYSRNNNQFYPLNEDFAELFMKDDTTGMGSVSEMNRNDLMRNIPSSDFRDLAIPPRTGRQVIASVLDYVEGSQPMVKKAFLDLLEKNADFTEAVRRFYPDEKIAKSLIVSTKAPDAKSTAKVNVVESPSDLAPDAPADTKKKLIERGYVVIDHRKESEKSKFGVFDVTGKFTNPTDSGFYTYVTENGTLRYGLILTKPMMLHQGFSTGNTIVVDLESDMLGMAFITDQPVFIKDQIRIQDYSVIGKLLEDPIEGLPSFSNVYVLVNENLRSTVPFRITQNYKDDNLRRLKVEPESWRGSESCSSPTPQGKLKFNNKFDRSTGPKEVTLTFTKRPGDSLDIKGSMVYVPKGFKLLQLRTHYYDFVPTGFDAVGRRKAKEEEGRIRAGRPGRLGNITELLMGNHVYPMTVHTNGSEYFFNIREAKKKYSSPIKAKIALVTDVGLDEKVAEEIIDNLIPDIQVNGYVKLAVTGDQMLSLQDEQATTDDFGNPTYYGVPWTQVADRSDGYTGDPTRKGLGVMPEIQGIDSEVGKAVQMANAGQKEIFDTQAIAALAKYVDPSDKVISYIPNFVSTMDKLGRMLFMIYWDTDKFQKMYGQDDLVELIELLKSVFKTIGDLVIFLKRKFPDTSINTSENGIDSV